MPARRQPSFPERVYVGVHDVCGPDEEDDESLHAAGPPSLSTHFPILKG